MTKLLMTKLLMRKLLISLTFTAGLLSALFFSEEATAGNGCTATVQCPGGGSATCRTPSNVSSSSCTNNGSQVSCSWTFPCGPTGGNVCSDSTAGSC